MHRVLEEARALTRAFFVSDLHGDLQRYSKLLGQIKSSEPAVVFVGGDILPSGLLTLVQPGEQYDDFLTDYLEPRLEDLRAEMGRAYPQFYVILGNDDPRVEEETVRAMAARGLWTYIHNARAEFRRWTVYGYSHVPPTPFSLKDWERYDVSRYVDPGSLSPEEGTRSVEVQSSKKRYATIADDLDRLAGDDDLQSAVFLFHSPPYRTALDRAALDGRRVEGVPLDVHVGSIAIRRFIEARQPLLTLHGHVHESSQLTGAYMERLGRTCIVSAAHHGPELALVRIDLEDPAGARRDLI
jgi:Icc-related predicted phosphoesterase